MRVAPKLLYIFLFTSVAVNACRSIERGQHDSTAQITTQGDVALPFETYTLDNGLRVILHEDRRLPLIAASIWYDVGALHEKPNRSGFAHLFEHMMFQSSPHVGEDQFFPTLEALGATLVNGTTGFDRTNYIATVPSDSIETLLWLESDRMGFLLASVTQASLQNQIEVVKNERRERYENAPYGMFDMQSFQALYPAPHPYHGCIIGSMADLEAATLTDVQEFFLNYYTPANATLTLAGDFDKTKIKALVERYFGSIQGRPKPASVEIPAPSITKAQTLRFPEAVGKLPKIVLTWMGPNAFEPDTAELELLTHVISGTQSSRLDRRVTHLEPIAQSVTAMFSEQRSGSQFSIELVVRPEYTVAQALSAVDEVLANLREHPPTTEELERAINSNETSTLQSLEALGGFSGRAERLQTYAHMLNDPGRLAWDLARFRKVQPQDLARVMKKYIHENRFVFIAEPAAAAPATQSKVSVR